MVVLAGDVNHPYIDQIILRDSTDIGQADAEQETWSRASSVPFKYTRSMQHTFSG